ncbi:MAG: tRNA (N6-threonylcarbamoyladenosine(37)-N6)-methyltransferase TrmO [Methanomicrobiales archaeon]|nr:tRNA (N6-threonylcarbamoyladenosine(37)-N6)-methyltransferase TrmO [Methanomicrobiales archaeon]
MNMISVNPIGIIHSPFLKQGEAPRQGFGCTEKLVIEIYPQYHEGLGNMEGISHIWVLYWMDRADRNSLTAKRPDFNKPKPVFSIRSPSRPNPIALSIGKIENISGGNITVTGIEALDGSPVIDIKPYVVEIDCIFDSLNPFEKK